MGLPNGWILGQEGRVQTRVYDGAHEGEVIVDEREYIGDILDLNSEQRSYGHARKYKEGLGEHVARIPMTIATKLQHEGIMQDPQRFKKWLDDPDNAVFRTNTMPLTKGAMRRKYG